MVAHSGLDIFNRGEPYNCVKCNRRYLNKYDLYYRCSQRGCPCKGSYTCRLCALSSGPKPFLKPGGTVFPSIHNHPMVPNQNQGGWICDMSDPDHEAHTLNHGGTCLLRMGDDYEESKYIYALECRKCDFDVCLKCIFNKPKVKEIQSGFML